ncbi:hypothetical protein MKW98_021552 [Papaver atlanticum]|uniref:Thaumatin-like protein n=1 Tax=Papaver atlanticum TaxID=357466 RepID=A0AAD4T9H3_9MAGN|nr:hypothetical protein MKW98_021552 [Papaver atlanticum]
MIRGNLLVGLISFLLIVNVSAVSSATFTMTNKCNLTVWPAIISSSATSTGISPLNTTGFPLPKDESRILTVPSSWTGRLWGRTHCSSDSTGNFSCISGDCGSGKVECSGGGATPPLATLAEFSLNALSGLDFYDVSFVNGFNLPMLVVPKGGKSGNCSTTGCVVNLTEVCPNDLKVTSQDGSKVACKSACQAFGDPQYCCPGNRNSCKPSIYSEFFKKSCPRAHSYALDDATSTFSSASANYVITFCPPLSTIKRGTKTPEAASGGKSPEVVGVSSSSPQPVSWVQFLGGAVSLYISTSSSGSSLWRNIILF